MTTNQPPTYTFGSFNSSFFQSAYLNYPIAQGAETIATMYSSSINPINSTLSINSSTLRNSGGMTSGSLGTPTITGAGSIALYNSTTSNTITMGDGLTSGDINIGCGVSRLSGSNINIGTSTGTGGNVNLGSSTSNVNFPNGYSVGSGYSPTANQVGYTKTNTYGVITATTSAQFLCGIGSLSLGVYLLTINIGTSTATNASAVCQIYQSNITGCTTTLTPYNVGTNGLQAVIPICFSGVLYVTNTSNAISFSCAMTPNGTLQLNTPTITAIKLV